MADKKVLAGHKKVKSRFIPPLMQLPNLRETSYVNDMLPHVVWMSLLIQDHGKRDGIRYAFDLAKLAHEVHGSEKHFNFAICGSYSHLTEDELARLVQRLTDEGRLDLYRQSLSPLVALHPTCPMAGLGLPGSLQERATLIGCLRDAVDAILDRYENPAAIMHANVFGIRAATGGLFIADHIEMPDLDALVFNPESDAAKQAASFVRSSAMQEFSFDEDEGYRVWPKAFWDANYRLDPCSLFEEGDE